MIVMADGGEGFVGSTEALAQTEAQASLQTFWARVAEDMTTVRPDFKNQELPLARIKKIMKLDEDVKMISAEAPLLFAKAAEIFISELSLRAWIHTEDNKRRTLQRNDIAMAVSKFDQFDFLIDIVPREETKPAKREGTIQQSQFTSDQVQYYFQLPQQQAQNSQPIQLIAASAPATGAGAGAQQIIQLPQTVSGTHQVSQQHGAQAGGHVFQPVVTANGDVQSIPIQLSAAQLQAIQMQMQGSKQQGQPIIIHTQAMQQAATTGDVTVSQAAYAGQQQQIYIQQGSGGYLQQTRSHEQHTTS